MHCSHNPVTVGDKTLNWDQMQCDELVELGASVGETPAAVIKKCKFTIGMLSDPSAALSVGDLLFGIWFLAFLRFVLCLQEGHITGDCLGGFWQRWRSWANWWWKRLRWHVNSWCWYFFKDQWGPFPFSFYFSPMALFRLTNCFTSDR